MIIKNRSLVSSKVKCTKAVAMHKHNALCLIVFVSMKMKACFRFSSD